MSDRDVVITPRRGIERTFRGRVAETYPLVVTWTARDLRVRYRQSLLRSGWSLLQPVMILATYGWVLTAVLGVRHEEVGYLAFAWAGIVPFTFFSQALGLGVGSIQQAAPIISRLAFPREVLPLAVVGGALVDLLIMTVTLVVVAWVQVGPPTVHLLGLLPVFAVLVLWTTAMTVGAAAVTVFRRDLNFAVPLALRVWFIVTPVMYPAALISAQIGWAAQLNPLTVVVEGTRDAVYRGSWPDPIPLGAQALAATVALVVAFTLFRRLEPRMSDFA